MTLEIGVNGGDMFHDVLGGPFFGLRFQIRNMCRFSLRRFWVR